jgi:hypothetical protein
MSSPGPDVLATSLIPEATNTVDVGSAQKRFRTIYSRLLDGVSALFTTGVGYSAGGVVTQLTDKATTVVLNAPSGEITLANVILNAATIVSFTFTNSFIGATDVLVLNHVTTGTFGSYGLNAHGMAAGSCTIDLRNNTAANLTEAIVIRFAIIKGANA